MSEETTRNFLEVMRSFQWPDPKPISYRLYHDADSRPLFYTMEDLPGTYIEVDAQTYTQACYDVKVKEGCLVILLPKMQVSRLVSDLESGTSCDTRDICVVTHSGRPHKKWKKTTNDID